MVVKKEVMAAVEGAGPRESSYAVLQASRLRRALGARASARWRLLCAPVAAVGCAAAAAPAVAEAVAAAAAVSAAATAAAAMLTSAALPLESPPGSKGE